jgi:hypothetical protein
VDESTDGDAVHNDVSGSVHGHVIQGRDLEVHFHAAPEPPKPKVSEYLLALERAIGNAVEGGKPLVVIGTDAVKAVGFWAGRAGNEYYRDKTAVVDFAVENWRDNANLLPHHLLVLLLNVRTLDQIREFRAMRTWPGQILVVVATPHEVIGFEGLRVLRTEEVQARTATFPLLPSGLRYTLHPAKIAFPVALVATLLTVYLTDLPGLLAFLLAVLAAGIGALAGYGIGHVARGMFPPTGGELVISPDGIELTELIPWRAVEFVALVPREGGHALLMKTTRTPDRLALNIDGMAGLCLVGVRGLHCDSPATTEHRAKVLGAIRLYWPGPVLDTREALLDQDKQLGDRIWPGPRSV